VTASMAWPNFHREMEERSTNRWQHRLKREHQLAPSEAKIAHEECGWKGGDRGGWGAEEWEEKERARIAKRRSLSFLTEW
jgi:hypothetical protein